MRVVIDTNIVVSALIYGQRDIAKILQLWKMGKYNLLMSTELYKELEQVLCRPKFSPYINQTYLDAFFELLKENTIWVSPQFRLDIVSKDPTDNRLLELALAGQAQYLITGDNHLLDIAWYESIFIIKPAIFLASIDTTS